MYVNKKRKAKKAKLGSGDLVTTNLDSDHNKTASPDSEHLRSPKIDNEHLRTKSTNSQKNIRIPPTAEWIQLKSRGFMASTTKMNSELRLD